MATDRRRVTAFIRRLRVGAAEPGALPPPGESAAPSVPPHRTTDLATATAYLRAAGADERAIGELLDPSTVERLARYERVIEGFVGTAKIPVGLAGPLLVNGLHAKGTYWVPLATTEAALVGSYARGARALSRSGGVSAMLLAESMARSPCFVFDRALSAGRFVEWLAGVHGEVKRRAESTSRFARLEDLRFTLNGNWVYVSFEYSTGDAAGQNMTTLATEAACEWIVAHTPVSPERWYLEGNLSGDKKASAQSYCLVRGRKVTGDAVLPQDVLRDELRCTAETICDYWRVSAMGGVLSGTLGIQGHFANGLAGLFLATGQDVACVAESAMGATRLEARPDGALYASVTLPSLVLGTAGGGTHLPTAEACLRLMGLDRAGGASALAEIAAALLLAGELSLVAAIATGSFGRAHRVLRQRGAGKAQPADHVGPRDDQTAP